MTDPQDRVDRVLAAAASSSGHGEVLWGVRADDGRVDASVGDQHRPFFIASATKLFVSATLGQMRSEGHIDWDRPVAEYLPDRDLSGLGSIRGFTIRQALAHEAGLPDYFEGRMPSGPSVFERCVARDFSWSVDDVIEWSRAMVPPRPGRALYSDTGYQLLGAVIEAVSGRSLSEEFDARIIRPLGLSGTRLFDPSLIDEYSDISPMLDGVAPLRIPLAMTSVRGDGGVISTVHDALEFVEAFFDGRLIAEPVLEEMCSDWHRIFPPLTYGTGVMRFSLNRLATGGRRVPAFLGHSGASGTVLFRSPERGLTVVGTVNQVRRRSRPFRIMVKAAMAAGPPRSS